MMAGFVQWLLDPSGLTPHGFCLLWEPWLIWTHALANIATGIAYFTIPLALARFARRRRDLAFRPVFWLFAAFILLCGTGHWLDLLTLWLPAYGVEAVVKAGTAVVSVFTAAALWPLMPKALALPSPAQMRAANAALRESEARQRASYINTPLPLHTLDNEGVITDVSDRWLALLGYSRKEVVGRNITEFQEPDSAEGMRADWARLLAEGELLDAPRRFLHRDGGVVEVLESGRVECLADDSIRILGALVDITPRRRAEEALRASEERLRQSQKMEAIGQLTGGIAHDFNNMLTAVTGNLELIRRRLRDERPDIARFAENALTATGKAAGLTAQLLSFARRQRLDPGPVNPVEVVEGMRALLARTAGDRIALRVEAGAAVGLCLADRNQMESAVLNLVINARDAIGAGAGTITVSLRAERLGATSEGWPPAGDYVRIAVRDDGPGMPEEVRRHAFEPFFTTKPLGQGTGLGLAQIHGFAHQSGGTATIENVPGGGAEVAILLPRTSATQPARQPGREGGRAQAAAAESRGHGETVLVVEDDVLVRAALTETLRDLDYRAIDAADADAALVLLEGGVAVDVILTDLAMPGSMDGLGFAGVVRARCPGLPVLLTTGHLDPFRRAQLPPDIGFIQKPYDRARVATALRRVLHRREALRA